MSQKDTLKEFSMKKNLALLALLLGAILPMPAIASGKDCNKADPLCDAYKHPRKVETKPLPCVPVRFDQLHPATVVLEISHPKLGTRRLSSKFGLVGQRCFGEHWLSTATVTICDDDKSFVWTPAMIEAALASGKKLRGLDGTLKGTKWYSDHKEKYD
ncbi:MAG: hypothetical protein Q7S75_00845 [bacterium]|nr:hypothetical protein [bacterium]